MTAPGLDTASATCALPRSERLVALSPLADGVLRRHPEFTKDLSVLPAVRTGGEWRRWLDSVMAGAVDRVRALRTARQRALVAVIAREIESGDAVATGRDLAGLGAACIGLALEMAMAELAPRFGLPRRGDGARCRFVVMGLGGLGGFACDFGGDVDVVFVHETDRGQTDGGDGRGEKLDNHAYFGRLCQRVAGIAGDLGVDGAPFRLSLELRPEGRTGTICNSMDAVESYLETFGSPADRLAWMKARPVAGDLELGEALLDTVRPFVFRKHLDQALVEEIAALKRRIDAQAACREDAGWFDVKLGHGGLVELEFAVQTIQLVWGGRLKELRSQEIPVALDHIQTAGLLDAGEVQRLVAAWRFLCGVGHASQITLADSGPSRPSADSGSGLEPRDSPRVRMLDFLGLEPAVFAAAVEEHRHHVGQAFAAIVAGVVPPSSDPLADSTLALLFEPDAPHETRIQAARTFGFLQPEPTLRCLDLLLRRPQSPFHLRTRADGGPVASLARRVLQACVESAAPDDALRHFEAFFRVVEHRRQALAQLTDDPKRLRVLATVFGTSHTLSRLLVRSPGLIDRLVLEGHEPASRDRRAFVAMIAEEIVLSGDDWEGTLGAVRRVFAAETLRIGFHDLAGIIDNTEVTAQLSLLAEVIIDAVFAAARRDLEHRFDCNFEGFGVIAGGKLAGRELGYRAELDLVFVHGPATEPQLAMRLARAVITGLTCATPEGLLYDLDTQQRPSGNQGPVCILGSRFAAYHAGEAAIWKMQTALRMRPIIGDASIVQVVREARISALGAFAAEPERARREIAAQLRRIHIAAGEVDRVGEASGLSAVRLLVQYLQLILPPDAAARAADGHAAGSPSVAVALGGLADTGVAGVGSQLGEAWSFLNRIENRLAIAYQRSGDSQHLLFAAAAAQPHEDAAFRRLALRLGYSDARASNDGGAAAALAADHRRHHAAIEQVVTSIFGRMGDAV